MSWASGHCEDCGCCQYYKFSWGYEKPHGLDRDSDGVLRCDECRNKNKSGVKPTNDENGRLHPRR